MTTPSTTPPSVSPLSVMDWISCTPLELKARGVDPLHRVHYTGHTHHVLEAWVPAIGNWAICTTHEFINTKAPHKGRVRVTSNAYHQYRYRLGLMTGPQFELIHGECRKTRKWFWAERCWKTYRDYQLASHRINGTTLSIGKAWLDIYTRSRASLEPTDRLGMLPVEMVLWTRLFDTFLSTIASWEDWEALEDGEKSEIWSSDQPWDLDRIAHCPAALRLGDQRRFARAG